MDKLKSLQTDLKTAQDALTALQDELPQFHALLTDNEQDAQRLKSERASLDAQSQARGRVQIAKEMLEQHHADIATARAEVTRLEGELRSVERQKALDALQVRRNALQAAWDGQARQFAHAIVKGLDELYRLECEATLEQREIADAVRQMEYKPLERISFSLRSAIRPHLEEFSNTPNHMYGLSLARHHYRLTLSTDKLPIQDRA